MNTKIQTFVPKRDYLGRFRTTKRTKAKILFVIIALGSLYLNYHLLKTHYVFGCMVNGKVVAHFISKETCGDLFTDKMDSLELARKQRLEANLDIYQ